jgi:hypothetical protein
MCIHSKDGLQVRPGFVSSGTGFYFESLTHIRYIFLSSLEACKFNRIGTLVVRHTAKRFVNLIGSVLKLESSHVHTHTSDA